MRNIDNYHPVIGLEVHVELKTKSKMFCGCSADYFGKEPNTHVCPVCLGLPGALPVPNRKAIEWCVMIGLALNCKIPLVSKFDRKNYFYPDLPKGYQISQYDEPFCVNGKVVIARSEATKPSRSEEITTFTAFARNDTEKVIRIRRVHMEEDTAKLIHQFGTQNSPLRSASRNFVGQTKLKTQNYEGYSLIDFNRSGVPLVEIVTEPDFKNAAQVKEYLQKLQQIVRYLDVSDADMEKGEMRLEPNISLLRHSGGSETTDRISSKKDSIAYSTLQNSLQNDNNIPSYKVEVKNINSFRFVEKAINYEVERQKRILESGKTPIQETRGWDSGKQITVVQRVKEEASDYRYFPEPDIPPIRWAEYQISNIKYQIPELPDERCKKFQKEYSLSIYYSAILTREKTLADYFEEAVRVNQELRTKNQEVTDIKSLANWIINKKVDIEKILPAQVIKDILRSTKKESIDSDELNKIIDKVVLDNPKAISDYKKGKTAVIGFLIGQIKKITKQPLDTQQVEKVMKKVLKTK